MKKLLTVKEAFYAQMPKKIEKVETLVEHSEVIPLLDKINVLVNEVELTENGFSPSSLKILVEKKDFKELFGKGAKPHKGDVVSITGLADKFKVKKSKKYSAKKKGKGYKLSLKKS